MKKGLNERSSDGAMGDGGWRKMREWLMVDEEGVVNRRSNKRFII